ncbi:hypothetical protein [Anthocerotibacter panamensis]|nr:hypothetical protein [Anthocerotibacter panamensis]
MFSPAYQALLRCVLPAPHFLLLSLLLNRRKAKYHRQGLAARMLMQQVS